MSLSSAEEAPTVEVDELQRSSKIGRTVMYSTQSKEQTQNINPENHEALSEKWPPNIFAGELDKNLIIVKLSEVKGTEDFFNATAYWSSDRRKKILLGRKVLKPARDDEPDTGELEVREYDADMNAISVIEAWDHKGKDYGIEDPRAYQKKNGKTILGFTYVNMAQGNKTYPAFIKLMYPEQLQSEPFPKLRIIDKYGGGDQTTPVGGGVEGKNITFIGNAEKGADEDEDIFMYRPEGMNHTLQVLRSTAEDDIHVGFIEFPDYIPWAQYKIGTTAPPAWLNEREAFIELHGINKVDGLFVYSIGTARLVRSVDKAGKVSFSVDNISKEAILTPDDFPKITDGRQTERHPTIRRAEYNTGALSYWNKGGELEKRELFPSQGDMRTYDFVIDAATIITSSWDRTIYTRQPQAVAA